MAHRNLLRAIGIPTRGTTGHNRLRRMDRYVLGPGADALDSNSLVVDLGYGAHGATTLELFTRLRSRFPHVQVLGLEIDPERVAAAKPLERPGLSFARGGFEVPAPRAPAIIRAANVLRQYPREHVLNAWALMTDALAPGGYVLDGTCDEIGRRTAFLRIDKSEPTQPTSLTLSLHLPSLARPSDAAPRLPKWLIHHNVPGQPVNAWLTDLDAAWERAAPLATFGPRQRWIAACRDVGERWPLQHPQRFGLGEVTVDYAAIHTLER